MSTSKLTFFYFFFTLCILLPWTCCRVSSNNCSESVWTQQVSPGTARLPDLLCLQLEQLCVFTPGRSESRSDPPPIPGGCFTCLNPKADNCSDSPAGTPGSRPDPDHLPAAVTRQDPESEQL